MEIFHLYGYLCIHQQTFASMKALLVADMRVLRWRIYIEEYLLTFHNMKGTDNVKYYRFYLSPPEA